jgi:hypothetical protein
MIAQIGMAIGGVLLALVFIIPGRIVLPAARPAVALSSVFAPRAAPTAAPATVSAANPNTPQLGPLAGAPADDLDAWFVQLANRLGNPAPSVEILAFLSAWARWEGTYTSHNNPFNTTQEMPGAWVFGGHGEKHYTDMAQGLEATVITLGYDYPGYAEIAAGIRTNDAARALDGLAASPWGTGDGARAVYAEELAEYQAKYPAAAAPAPAASAPAAPSGKKHPVTDTMEVSANFTSTGSGAWSGQAGGMHWGTDFAGNPGDPVYAPFDLTFEMTGFYGDPGRYGHYLIGRFDDGTLFYSGHLADVIQAAPGQRIAAGTVIGHIGELYHTHIKLEPPGSPHPCEGPGTCVDFEEYYQER